jgi:hypothetical protein
MKTVVALTALVLPGIMLSTPMAGARSLGGEREAEEQLVKDTLQSYKDVTAVLKTVKDAKSAEAALAKLDDPAERLVVRSEALQTLFDKPAAKDLQKKHADALEEAGAALRAEYQRLGKHADALKVLNTNKEWKSLTGHLQAGFVARAKVDVQTLDKAVQTYIVKNGKSPATLQELTQRTPDGGAALLKETALIDPWGNPYQYDPNQLNPYNATPKIWTNGDPAQGGKTPISNWDNIKDFDKYKKVDAPPAK